MVDVYPDRTHSAPSSRVVKPWVRKTKVRNKSNAHGHEHTRSTTHPTNHPPTPPTDPTTYRRTSLPTHDVLQAMQQRTAADALVPICCDTGISMFLRFSATAGIEQTRPREGASPRSQVAELGTAPVMRRGQRRADVWVGRGATARPWEAKWSLRVAAVLWVCYNEDSFKDPNDYYDVTSG